MQTDAELDEMAKLAAGRKLEVSLFARPNAGWDTSAMARSLREVVSRRLREDRINWFMYWMTSNGRPITGFAAF